MSGAASSVISLGEHVYTGSPRFVSGADDPVGDMGKGVRKVERAFRKAGMRDVQMALYPGMRHEILNELDRRAVYNDIFRWMESRMGTPAGPFC